MTAPAHGSALYRTIHDQPRVLRDVLARCAPGARDAAQLLRPSARIFLSGTGTSFHAALVGQQLLRSVGRDAWAISHQAFALYPPRLTAADALLTISHRGAKRYGVRSVERARAIGMPIVGLTGRDSRMDGPAVVIPTAPQEVSSTHTASYTGSLAALAMVAAELGGGSTDAGAELARALPQLPAQVDGLLAREAEVAPVAEHLARGGRVVYAGAGPNAATATEGALKVKESSYLVAEGFELEMLLHGGLQALQPGDLAVLVAPQGPALDRFADLLRALGLLGARPWLVGDRGALDAVRAGAGSAAGSTAFELPRVPEPLSPVLAVVPLQLLACFTAERRGTDPDSFREDDPVFERISASYEL